MTHPGFLIGIIVGAVVFGVAYWREKKAAKENERAFNKWVPIVFGGGMMIAIWIIGLITE